MKILQCFITNFQMEHGMTVILVTERQMGEELLFASGENITEQSKILFIQKNTTETNQARHMTRLVYIFTGLYSIVQSDDLLLIRHNFFHSVFYHLLGNDLYGIAADHQLFVGRDTDDFHAGVRSGDDTFLAVHLVGLVVQTDV